MENTISKALYSALESKYNSEINQSYATLLIYFKNPVGIGEHPQHLEEMDKLIENIVSNRDKLDCLKNKFASFNNLI